MSLLASYRVQYAELCLRSLPAGRHRHFIARSVLKQVRWQCRVGSGRVGSGRVGSGRVGNYVSAKGLQVLLVYAVEKVFSGEIELLFREKLRTRLEGGQEERIAELKQRIIQRERKIKLLLRLLSSTETEDPAVVEEEYRQVLAEKRRSETELQRFEAAWSATDTTAIEQQLKVNPRKLLPDLFSGTVAAEQVRAALRRLFPKIVYKGKSSRFCSRFVIEFAPGVMLAEGSGTQDIDDDVITLEWTVTGGPKRPSVWVVEEVSKKC